VAAKKAISTDFQAIEFPKISLTTGYIFFTWHFLLLYDFFTGYNASPLHFI